MVEIKMKFKGATPADSPGFWNDNAMVSFFCKGDMETVEMYKRAIENIRTTSETRKEIPAGVR